MDSYFFVPANRLHKIESMQKLGVDEIIIDLEDAIKTSERELYLKALAEEHINRSLYVRVPIYDLANTLDLDFYFALQQLGYTNFIFPKISGLSDIKSLINHIGSDEKIVLLVETPLLLVELKEVLSLYHHYFYGIGIGSHDLMNYIGGEHTLANIEFYRNMILLHAKAYHLKAFDIASMELKDKKLFQHEIMDGFKKGFDAKFYIHPWQIAQKNELSLYSAEDLIWAKKIYQAFLEVGNAEEFNPIVVDGEIIEKPHLNKVFTILKYFKQNDSK